MVERTEEKDRFKKNIHETGFRCTYKLHPGKMPRAWEVKNKCKQRNCVFLKTKEEYDAWCKTNNVFFYD